MEDIEFEVLDQLYFITSYEDLQSSISYEEMKLTKVLISLFEKDWIRVYSSADVECYPTANELEANLQSYYYLASKKGLFAHNSF